MHRVHYNFFYQWVGVDETVVSFDADVAQIAQVSVVLSVLCQVSSKQPRGQ